jgi:hypothetical protein
VAGNLAERIGLLTEQAQSTTPARLVAYLANEASALFPFLHNLEIDTTNWQAEQAVVNRTVRGGNPHLARRGQPRAGS